MAVSIGQSYTTPTSIEHLQKQFLGSKHHLSTFPLKQIDFRRCENVSVLHRKPLYISAVSNFGYVHESKELSKPRESLVQCNAYEANRSQPIPISIELDQEAREAAAQKLKIGLYFATWWSLNVVFNIYNKKVLNAFPFPWLTSTLSLAAGSLLMLVSWATRIAEAPKTDYEFWKTLLPVSQKFSHLGFERNMGWSMSEGGKQERPVESRVTKKRCNSRRGKGNSQVRERCLKKTRRIRMILPHLHTVRSGSLAMELKKRGLGRILSRPRYLLSLLEAIY